MMKITPEILNLISKIDEFKGQWQALKNISPEKLNQLRKVSTIESIGSSTRIEGVKLSDREVEALLSRIDAKQFDTRDEQEVAGYADVMNLIYESFRDIPLSENYIKQLHKVLLHYSTKDLRHSGEYKNLFNNIEAFDPSGVSLGIIFETSSPFNTPIEMSELVLRTSKQLDTGEMHPLITIADFIIRFLAIHPFLDGNGRISRSLTTLLLLRTNYSYVPYASIESIIEENKDSYYKALRKTQKNLASNDDSWLLFFLKTLKRQTEILTHKVTQAKLSMPSLPDLSIQILDVIKTQGSSSVKELEQITGANRNTLKKHLTKLVNLNHLDLKKQGRSSFYQLK